MVHKIQQQDLLWIRSYNMNISDAKYVVVKGENVAITCTIDGVKAGVPIDPANRHYAEILKQVKEGTLTIKDAD